MKKKEIDENILAREITLAEGKKRILNIGDVKEVIRLIGENFANRNASEIILWWEKHCEKVIRKETHELKMCRTTSSNTGY